MDRISPEKLRFQLMAGHAHHDERSPHWVSRPGGLDRWLLEYSHDGQATVHLDGGKTFTVLPGEFLAFRPAVPQYYHMSEEPNFWNHYWFSFTPRPHWLSLLDMPEAAPGIYCIKIPDVAMRNYLKQRMTRAVEIVRGPLARNKEFVMNIVEELLLHIDSINPKRQDARLDRRIRRAMQHICDNAGERITLKTLAQVCNMSPSRLSHLFRSEVGVTPMAYLQDKRMDFARDMLAMSSAPIKQIAAHLGFDNPFYFSRVFKSHCGQSPSDFREKFTASKPGRSD